MGKARWGAEPEFFGPRHAHRESRILRAVLSLRRPPGPHLECAAGVGSLSASLASRGRAVVAGDMSLRSLAVIRSRIDPEAPIYPVVCDITNLPFPDNSFSTATSAETLEHIPNDGKAAHELWRVLAPGGSLVGTVPAGPEQFSDWDVWADHKRRYTKASMCDLLETAGFRAEATVWGWPVLRLYDDLFLKRVNRRRLQTESVAGDPTLQRVSGLGKRRWLVALVRSIFTFDRLFDGVRWGVGLVFVGRKSTS